MSKNILDQWSSSWKVKEDANRSDIMKELILLITKIEKLNIIEKKEKLVKIGFHFRLK